MSDGCDELINRSIYAMADAAGRHTDDERFADGIAAAAFAGGKATAAWRIAAWKCTAHG